jgi:hypothetical protein
MMPGIFHALSVTGNDDEETKGCPQTSDSWRFFALTVFRFFRSVFLVSLFFSDYIDRARTFLNVLSPVVMTGYVSGRYRARLYWR